MKKAKEKTNTIYFGKNDKLDFVELPEGYFYKNKFYTETQCFNALLEDDEVRKHDFSNGTWSFRETLFSSLKELYEWNEDEFDIPYEKLKKRYEYYGIKHNDRPCTLYAYNRDDDNSLFSSKGELLLEIRNETNLIESEEDREDRYFFSLEGESKEKMVEYFNKPISKRIKILEEFGK